MAILTQSAIQQLANYKEEFLTAHPNTGTKVNPDFNSEEMEGPQNPATVPMTDLEWLEHYTVEHFKKQIRRGKLLIEKRSIRGQYNDFE